MRGRVGYLFTPTLLIYGTAGFAYGGVDAFGFSNTRTGWTAGGGLEWLFAPHWSAKVEYLYVDLASNGTTGAFGWTLGNHFHPQLNVVRVGVNYHFNFAPPAPVVAKYLIRRGDFASVRTDRERTRPLWPGFSIGRPRRAEWTE